MLFNDLLEEWVDTILVEGFSSYITRFRFGMPTVHLEAGFKSISRMGDEVTLTLRVRHIGTRSFSLGLACAGSDAAVRMSADQTIVTTSLETHRAIPIPPELRAALVMQAGLSHLPVESLS